MKQIFTDAAEAILTLMHKKVGGLVLSFFSCVFVVVVVEGFCYFGFVWLFGGFFKNVHLRKNLRYLMAGTKPKVYQIADI